MKTNSQTLLSDELYLGDIDGDGLDELIEVDGRHIHVFKANGDHTPVLEHAFPAKVKRLIIGDFVASGREHGKDQIFAILEDGSLRGYAISNDKTEMWWWFTQPSFIKSNQHYVVGDFDGDGADEILVYKPSTGSMLFYEMKSNGLPGRTTAISLGNLSSHDRKNKLLLAGNFGQAANRTDLLLLDRASGRVERFDTATDNKGVRTFWWAFTSKTKRFNSKDDVIVANLDGGSKDSLVVRSYGTGRYSFYDLEYNDGNLLPVSNVEVGQLPVKPRNGTIVAAKVRDKKFRNETGGKRRDDILFYNPKNLEFIRTDARYDGKRKRLTHWWAYTTNLIFEPQMAAKNMPWAVMLCRFKGSSGDPAIEKLFRELFEPGKGGMIEYWHDISLGVVDIGKSRVFGWVELDIPRSKANDFNRGQLIDKAIAATKRAGFDPVKGFHKQLAVFTHNFSNPNAPSNLDWRDATWGQFWIDGSADGQGRVSAPPHGHNGSFIAHEMGHGTGFDHDRKSNLTSHYGDPTCIMSAMTVRSYTHPTWNVAFGPAMSFPQLHNKGWVYPRRVYKAPRSWVAGKKLSFEMAPLSDRRQPGHLGVIVPTRASGGFDYYLEYMVPSGWNQAVGSPRVVIRRRVDNTAAYIAEAVASGTKGQWRAVNLADGIQVRVQKIRSDNRRVKVEVLKI